MSQFHSILSVLEENARNHPDQLAFAALQNGAETSSALTFAQLRQSVISVAGHLRSMVGRGERALLLYEHSFDFLVPFLACLYAGLVAVPAPLPNTFTAKRAQARMHGILQDARPALALTNAENRSALETTFRASPEFSGLKWVATDLLASASGDWDPEEVSKGEAAYLQYTSGSTSAPKGVVVTHGNIMHQVDYLRRVWTKDDHITGMVCWMPYYHDMGLFSGIFFPLFMSAPCHLMSPVTFIRRPESWLQAVTNFKASHTVGPVFAYELCSRKLTLEQRGTLDLTCLKMACLGAEPIQPGIVDGFIETFRPHGFSPDALIPGYGLAEATLAVTVTPLTGGPVSATFDKAALARRQVVPAKGPDATRLFSSGRPLTDVPVHIVNENTFQRCAPNEIGEIWLGGESIADGYWEKDEANRAMFQARLADTGEGSFLRTGDLGFFYNDMIYIAGRIKDMMIFQGQNFYPQDIEWTAQGSHPDAQKGGCAAFSVDVDEHEQLVVCQEVTSREADRFQLEKIASAVRRAIALEHGLTTHAVVLYRKGGLPKTSSGKIQRHAARNDYLNGGSESVVHLSLTEEIRGEQSAPRDELESALVKMFEEILKISPVGLDDNFFERGGDSLGFILLSELIEERLGQTLSLERPMENLTVRALAHVLAGEKPLGELDAKPKRRMFSGLRFLVRKFPVTVLKLFSYSHVDGFARWLGRQAWAGTLLIPRNRREILAALTEIAPSVSLRELKSQWIYSGLLYNWRISALNDPAEFSRQVRVTGLEHLEHARGAGQGVILLNSNVGLKHLAIVLLANLHVENLMQIGGGKRRLGLVGLGQYRSRFLLEIEDELIKSNSHLSFQLAKGKQILEQGGVLVLAGDGQRGLNKVEFPFLDRRRTFRTGAAELAVATDSLIIPAFISLHDDGTVDFVLHPPLTTPEADRASQIRSLIEQYARLLEEYWRTNLPNVRARQLKHYLTLPRK